MQKALLKLLLGNQASSSVVGYALLAFDLFHQLSGAGFDFKLTLLGVGVFFVLRFMNEHGYDIAPLLNEVLAIRAEQQVTGLIVNPNPPIDPRLGAIANARGLPLPDAAVTHNEQQLRDVDGQLQATTQRLLETEAGYDDSKDALRRNPDVLRADL